MNWIMRVRHELVGCLRFISHFSIVRLQTPRIAASFLWDRLKSITFPAHEIGKCFGVGGIVAFLFKPQ